MYGYVSHNNDEIGFCSCFTCGKGTMGDGVSGNGSRWVEMHAKSKECKKSHKQRLAEFKQKIGEVAQPTTVIIQTPVSNSVSALWDKLKAMPQLSPFMKEIEAAYQEFESDNDGSFVFDAAEGFKQTAISAVGYRRETLKCKEDKCQMEETHESILMEMRDKIHKLTTQVNNLLDDNKQLNQRVGLLERENGRYKSTYPPLLDDPQ